VTTVVKKGNLITWTTTPRTPAGAVASPDSVLLTIDYPYRRRQNGSVVKFTVHVPMTPGSGGTWTAEWDSGAARSGILDWAIQATNPSSSDFGSVTITASTAQT